LNNGFFSLERGEIGKVKEVSWHIVERKNSFSAMKLVNVLLLLLQNRALKFTISPRLETFSEVQCAYPASNPNPLRRLSLPRSGRSRVSRHGCQP
jgi:hypothetical protein